MNTMNMPGFSAEASFSKTNEYRHMGGTLGQTDHTMIYPAQMDGVLPVEPVEVAAGPQRECYQDCKNAGFPRKNCFIVCYSR